VTSCSSCPCLFWQYADGGLVGLQIELCKHGGLHGQVVGEQILVLGPLAIRDAEAAGLQQLAVHHIAARLPAQQLDAVAFAVEKDVHRTAHRDFSHVLLDQRLEAMEALAYVARGHVKPEAHVAGQPQHLSARVGERSPERSQEVLPRPWKESAVRSWQPTGPRATNR
jgi:hypothetical protein